MEVMREDEEEEEERGEKGEGKRNVIQNWSKRWWRVLPIGMFKE